MSKRLLSFILVVAMVAALWTVPVFAEDPWTCNKVNTKITEAIDLTNQFTIEISADVANPGYLMYGSTYQIEINSDGSITAWYTSGTSNYVMTTTDTYNPYDPIHVVLVGNTTTLTFYVNGVAATVTTSGAISEDAAVVAGNLNPNGMLYFARQSSWVHVNIWKSTAATANQVRNMYNADKYDPSQRPSIDKSLLFNVDFSRGDAKETKSGIDGTIYNESKIQYHYDTDLHRCVAKFDNAAVEYDTSSLLSSINDGDFAMEVYVKMPDYAADSGYQFIAGTFWNNYSGFGIAYGRSDPWGSDGTEFCSVSGNGSTNLQNISFEDQTAQYSKSGWNHIVYSYSGQTETVYVNGALIGSSATGAAITTGATRTFRVGAFNPAASAFFANMDCAFVRLYSRDMSELEAQLLYRRATGSTRSTDDFLFFDVDFSRGTPDDRFGLAASQYNHKSNNDGTYVEYPIDDDIDRKVGYFDGNVFCRYTMNDSMKENLSNSFSMETYVKITEYSDNKWMFIAGSFYNTSPYKGFVLGYGQYNNVFGTAKNFYSLTQVNGDGTRVNDDIIYNESQFVHIVYVHDTVKGEDRVYHDGVLVNCNNYNPALEPDTKGYFKIGGYSNSTKYFATMYCAYVRLYSKALDKAEAQELCRNRDNGCQYTNSDKYVEADVNRYTDGVYPTLSDKLFGGWYTDSSFNTVSLQTSGAAYAKMVNPDVLTVKCQLTAGTTAESDKTNLRFLTTVDSLNYENLGFEITVNGKTQVIQSSKVYRKVNATTDTGFESYTPQQVCADSNYFLAFTLKNIPQSAFGTEITVRPFWTVYGGGRVYGAARTVTVNDGINN